MPEVLTDIQRAARYLYIQKLSFGGKVTGQTFGISPSSPPRFNILRLEEDLSQAHCEDGTRYVNEAGYGGIARDSTGSSVLSGSEEK